MIVRAAGPADCGIILEMLRQLARFEGGHVTAQAQDLQTAIARGRLEALLAETDGGTVGLLTLLPSFSSWRGRDCAVIHDLFVSPENRGNGVGQALLRAALDMARQRRWDRLDVNVLEWNARAQAFYGRFGLTPLPQWRIWRIEGEALEKPGHL